MKRKYWVWLKSGAVEPIHEEDDWPKDSHKWTFEGAERWYELHEWSTEDKA